MAKISSRRRVTLDSPEEVLNLAQRLLAQVRPYAKWLGLGAAVIAVGLGAWGINAAMQANRETKATAALGQMAPQAEVKDPADADVKALSQFVREYAGTRAAREAQLRLANLLFGLGRYREAAQAYESLLSGRDPGWDTLVNESLSYCYEGLGDFKKAAAVLKPVAEQTFEPLKSEVMRRLAMLYEKAQNPQEAAVYWRKLLAQSPNPALAPYLQERLAAAEAGSKKK
jgi:lipopolysaccharide biosynthesis regulator YciM